MLTHLISTVLLLLTAVICTVGVFWRAYDDSLLERVGLCVTAVWCTLRASTIVLPPSALGDIFELALYVGLAAYALGAAREKLRASRER